MVNNFHLLLSEISDQNLDAIGKRVPFVLQLSQVLVQEDPVQKY